MYEIREAAQKIISISDEIKDYRGYKEGLLFKINELKAARLPPEEYKKKLDIILRGRSEKDWISYYDAHISFLLKGLEQNNKIILDAIKKDLSKPTKKLFSLTGAPAPIRDMIKIDAETKKKYMKELNIERAYLRSVLPTKKKKSLVLEDYTVYESNFFSNVANILFAKIVLKLNKNFPKFYIGLNDAIRASDLKILSKSYASIMMFVAALAFVFILPLAFLLLPTATLPRIVQSFALAIIGLLGIFFGLYYYPIAEANERKKKIKNDMPFVIMHMAAVAGSGSKPITMFTLVLSSREYKGIEGEIRKIVNYVNLFGYNLSTALRAVSLTTPSPNFKDLLNGLVTNIESGGSIKEYLDAKAEDTLASYKLERNKYVQTLSTWSDLYTGVLIAAPLLFFATLAIIQTMGGALFGVSVTILAQIGTFVVIPALNIGFILFLNKIELE